MKRKFSKFVVVALMVVMGLVSIPRYEPPIQIYDRGYPMIRTISVVRSKRDQALPVYIHGGH